MWSDFRRFCQSKSMKHRVITNQSLYSAQLKYSSKQKYWIYRTYGTCKDFTLLECNFLNFDNSFSNNKNKKKRKKERKRKKASGHVNFPIDIFRFQSLSCRKKRRWHGGTWTAEQSLKSQKSSQFFGEREKEREREIIPC